MNNRNLYFDSFKISTVHAAYWSAYTILGTFLVSYLTQHQYSTTEVGIIVASATMISAFIQPVWGYLADNKFSLKKITISLMLIAIPFALLIPRVVDNFYILILINIILSIFERPLGGLLDTITNISASNNPKIIYGISRGMGSLFSAISTLYVGKFLEKTNTANVFIIFSGLIFLAVFILLNFDNYNLKRERNAVKISFMQTLRELLKNKAFVYLLYSNVLLNIGLKAALTFAPIMINNLGGTVADSGIAMAINTVGMLPMMIIYSFLLKKEIKNETLYFAAAIFTITRIFSMSLVSSVNGMLAIQIINSLSYGFLQPSMINALSEVIPINQRATAITIMSSSILIISSLFGDLFAGRLMVSIGAQNMFYIFTIVAIIGLLMFIPYIKNKKEWVKE